MTATTATTSATEIAESVAHIDSADWAALAEAMNERGHAVTPRLLTDGQCRELAALYDEVERFRSTVDMARYRFGSGRYRYFARPIPAAVTALREAFYPRLLPIARDWAAKLRRPAPWPDTFGQWMDQCHAAGQERPTPLLLDYRAGDWSALHRDLYGDLYFPMQVVIGLHEPGVDYTGGEFLMVEQRPRAQSRAAAILLPKGHGVIFTTRDRPIASARGFTAAQIRHGVSDIRSGYRRTLGLVLHDAA